MTNYESSNYPCVLDTDANLYLVHDSLRVLLIEDYNPGDTTITVFDENNLLPIWPATGFITLTEQCSDIDERAISFYYDTVTSSGFSGLVLLPGFIDIIKPANITNVTLNVMNYHHNVIKNALINIQQYMGTINDVNTTLLPATETTIMGRLAYLNNLVLVPKPWFTASATLGIAIPPNTFNVKFTNESFGTDSNTTYTWNVYDSSTGELIYTIIGGPGYSGCSGSNSTVDCYGNFIYDFEAGLYDVSLTVKNEFGSNTVRFDQMITARIAAPAEADFLWNYGSGQIPWITVDGFTSIRSPTTSFVSVGLENNIQNDSDTIIQYTWSMGDDTTHPNSPTAQALYSTGGVYDLILRTDTILGAYRITKQPACINIVEPQNLWLWAYQTVAPFNSYEPLNYIAAAGFVNAYEFGLLSETFKSAVNSFNIVRSESFISGNENGSSNEPQARTEFRRNVSFAPVGDANSGSSGTTMIYWAGQGSTGYSGTSVYANQAVNIWQYVGFTDIYLNQGIIPRPWNWVCLSSETNSYFLLGVDYSCGTVPTQSPTYQTMSTFNLNTLSSSSSAWSSTNYTNGAYELENNPVTTNINGDITSGNFSVYRGAWKGNSGYFLRNNAAGTFFRIKSFYMTQGTLGEEIQSISKLTDMPGPTKLEGELVSLSDGLFFFNNSGNISAYNDTTGVWETGGASANSAAFVSLQDSTNPNFNNPMNTLTAAGYQRTAYLSYDYSPNAFIKFNSLELAFYNLGSRPVGYSQFLLGVY